MTALVFSAGGMYSAWQVGAWKALRDHFQPDLVVGASAGAWNGWAVAGGCSPEALTELWMEPALEAVMRPGWRGFGVKRPVPLHEMARAIFGRFHPILPFGLTVVEALRMRATLVRDSEITWQHLAATCSIPVYFPPVRINGKLYVDGGVKGALPLWAASRMGATRVIALNVLTALPFRALRRILPPPAAPGLEVTLIEPSVALGPMSHALRWRPEDVQAWIRQGELDARAALPSITM